MVTVITPITLKSSGSTLILTVDAEGVGGWCNMELRVEGATIRLGAERLEYIADHLRSFLADASPGSRWIFSLSELHTSAYGEHGAGGATIQLTDAKAKSLARLVLTADEKNEWMRQLAAPYDSPVGPGGN